MQSRGTPHSLISRPIHNGCAYRYHSGKASRREPMGRAVASGVGRGELMFVRFSVAWSDRGLVSRHEIRVAGCYQLQTSHSHETRMAMCSLSDPNPTRTADTKIRFRYQKSLTTPILVPESHHHHHLSNAQQELSMAESWARGTVVMADRIWRPAHEP